MSYVIVMVFLTVTLFGHLPADAMALSVRRADISIDQGGSCMARWIQTVLHNSTATVTPHTSERLLKALLTSQMTSSLADLDPVLVAGVLAGDQQAAMALIQCTGESSTPKCSAIQSPCLNNGHCNLQQTSTTSRDFACECANGFEGEFCQKVANRCRGGVCGEGATCKPTSSGYVCLCPPMRTGRHCQTTWISAGEFSDVISSIAHLTEQQAALRTSVRNVASSAVGQVSDFLKRLEVDMTSSLEQRLSFIQSAAETSARRSDTRVNQLQVRLQQLDTKVQRYHQHSSQTMTSKQPTPKTTTTPTVAPTTATVATTSQRAATVSSAFDPGKKARTVQLRDNGRIATTSGYGSVVGRFGYRVGTHHWELQLRGYVRHMAIGVTKLPFGIYTAFGHSTAYAWFSDTSSYGPAKAQTVGHGKMSRWLTGDHLALTLDCDLQRLTMRLKRTGEQRTVNMSYRGEKLYLYALLTDNVIVDILSYSQL